MGGGRPIPDAGKTYYFALYSRDGSYNYSAPVYDSTDPGPFPSHLIGRIEESEFSPSWITTFDYDRDGDPDLLTGAYKAIGLWENKGTEGFAYTKLAGERRPIVCAADLDGDGYEDVLYAGREYYPEIAWRENHRGLYFMDYHRIERDFEASSLNAADFDGDGDVDILTSSRQSQTLVVWINLGEKTFIRKTLRDEIVVSLAKVGDIDRDGDVDILTFGDTGLFWWINSGNAAFTPAQIDDQYIAVYCADIGDVDGDDDIDFVTSNRAGDVAWWENEGNLQFERHDFAAYPKAWVNLFLVDFDGDGYRDVLCTTWGRTNWWQNDGAQNFSMVMLDRHAMRSASLPVLDMDRDGDLDVVGNLGTELGMGIRWWENTLPADEQAPSPVRELMAMPSSPGGVLLMWERPYESDFRGILLVRNTEDFFPTPERLVFYPDGDDTGPGELCCRTLPKGVDSYEDNEVAEATHYFYAAYACDEVPNYSDGAFTDLITEGDLAPPAQPTDLQVKVAFNEVVVTWTDPTDADFESVLVVRSTSGTLPWVPCGERYPDGDASGPEGLWCRNISKGTQMCVDETAETETTYWYAVYAYDEIPNYSEPVGVEAVVSLADSDWDGLPDEWENTYFGSLEQGAFDDFDGDSRSNLSEFHGGSNPADPQSVPGYAESPWPAPRGNGRRTGFSPYVAASSDAFAWAYCPDDAFARGTAVIGPDGMVYVGAQCRGDVITCVLSALTPEGELKWQYEARGQLDESPSVARDGTIYFGVGYGYGGTLHAVNPDGSKKWTAGFGAGAMMSSPAIGSDGTVYFTTSSKEMRAFSSDGRLQWSFAYDNWADGELTIGSDGTVYFGNRDGYFYALNPDGTEKWRFEANGEIRHAAAIGLDETIYFGTEDGWFYALSPAGVPVWSAEHGFAVSTSPAIGADGSLFAVGESMTAILNREDSDGDALPDTWEREHFGDLGQDGSSDPDNDSVTNLEEYRTRTNPTDPEYGRWFDMFRIPGRNYSPCVTTDQAGYPIVAYVAGGLSYGVYVMRWDGESWSYVGAEPSDGGGIGGSSVDHPCLTVDEFRNPILAWQHEVGFAGTKNIFVRKWNGEKWVNIGDSGGQYGVSGSPEEDCTSPVIATDLLGSPIVAWQRRRPGQSYYNLYVKRWTGKEWGQIEVCDIVPYAGPHGERSYDLVTDYRGHPVLVWVEPSSKAVLAKRWNGDTWEQIGDRVSAGGLVGDVESAIVPRVALSPSGNPAVAWLQKTPKLERESREAHMKIWDGTAWSALGGSASGGGVSNTDMVGNVMLGFHASGHPFVAWLCERTVLALQLPRIYARMWDGTNWVDMGEGSSSLQGVGSPTVANDIKKNDSPDLAVNPFGEAFLVYKEWGGRTGSEAIVLRKFSADPDSKIHVATPRGFQKGDVTVRFALTNSLSLPMDAAVEFTLDGGANWFEATATQGSEGLVNLASSPHGVEHTFVWDSASDGDQNVRNIARLRITATAGNIQARGITSSFHLGAVKDEDKDLLDDDWEMKYFGTLAYDRKSDPDSDRCPNILEQTLGTDPTDPSQPVRTPSVTVTTPTDVQSGDVAISYTLVDHNADPVSIAVHYSEDENNWYRATPASGGDGTTNLTSSRKGVPHTFVWNSAADLRHTRQEAVHIRITPFDAEEGSFGVTGPFTVDNTSPDVHAHVIPVAIDAEVRAQSPDRNLADAKLGVGSLRGAERRTYLWFDLSALPDGHVSGCELRMDVRSLLRFGDTADGTIRVRRADAPWEEDTITWSNQPPIRSTTVAEVSLREQPLDPLNVEENVVFSWRSGSLDALINSWVNGVANEGLLAEVDLEAPSGASELVFYSRESVSSDSGISPPRLLFDLKPYADGPKPTVFVSRADTLATRPLYDNDDWRVEVLSFRVEANDLEPVAVDSLSFSLLGTMNPQEDILSMSLFVDVNRNGLYDGGLVDIFLGTTTSLHADHVTFGPLEEPILPGQREDWLLVADFSGKAAKGEYLAANLSGADSIVCRGPNSGVGSAVLVEPEIESVNEIVSTSFKEGEFLVDDHRNDNWWILKGTFDGKLEEFIKVPESNRNLEPVGIQQDREGDIYVAMPRIIYKFSPTGKFISEVYRLPDGLSGMKAFVVDREDTIYFSANYSELYKLRPGEEAVEIPGGNIGFDTITALAVNEDNELFIADLYTFGGAFASNIYKVSVGGDLSVFVENLHEQVGGQYSVRSMAIDSDNKLHVLLYGYGIGSQRVYSVEENPDHLEDPTQRVFTLLMAEESQHPDFEWIAFQQDRWGITGDLYLRQTPSTGDDPRPVTVLNVTSPHGPSLTLEGFNWHGRRLAFPAPFCSEKDSDGDGIPDVFEDFNGNGIFEPELFETSPYDDSDAGLDFDRDGMTNLEEYLAGTDPTLSSSRLKVESIRQQPLGAVTVSWNSMSGRKYRVLYSDEPLGPEMTWTPCRESVVATGATTSFMDMGDAQLGRPHPSSFELRHRYYKVLFDH